jgi:hypothetical protein
VAFMVPEYWYGTMLSCPDDDSGLYPAEDFSKSQVAHFEDCDEDDILEEQGWWVRLSAPGYSDATDWSGPYETERQAREFVLDFHEAHPDTGDEMQWDYVDDDVMERLLGPEDEGRERQRRVQSDDGRTPDVIYPGQGRIRPDFDDDGDLDGLGIYTGDTDGTWGVSTLTPNPVTGSPYVRMFAREGDAVAYARDRVSKGPQLSYPRRSDQERPERNPAAKVYYIGSMPRHQLDEAGNRVFIPVYRVLRGHVRGADAILVFENKGVMQRRGEQAIRWVLDRRLSVVGRVDDQQIRIREQYAPKRRRRKKRWE